MDVKLKKTVFDVIRVTYDTKQFPELKRFCGDDVTITYESCCIDDYWCIRLFDYLKDEEEIVPINDFILKLGDGIFTILSSEDYNEYFEPMSEKKLEENLAD